MDEAAAGTGGAGAGAGDETDNVLGCVAVAGAVVCGCGPVGSEDSSTGCIFGGPRFIVSDGLLKCRVEDGGVGCCRTNGDVFSGAA